MITIHCIAYNEQVFLKYMIDHYRTRFPGCTIVVHDNESTDDTVKIALENGCEVRPYPSDGKHDDMSMTHLKNNCWKDTKTDWVLVCDPDELLDINYEQLKAEEALGNTIIRSEGWNMVNLKDDYDFDNIKNGTRVPQYDKSYLFNTRALSAINYTAGCHNCNPSGNVKKSDNVYKLYHYHAVNPDYVVARYKWTAERLSDNNKRHGMGTYNLRTEAQIRASFEEGRQQSQKVKE